MTPATGRNQPRAINSASNRKVMGRSISEAVVVWERARSRRLAGFGQGVVLLPVTLDKVERLDAQVALRVCRTAGFGEQESLRQVTAHVAQDLELLEALDALGDHLDVQAARHGDDGSDDGVVGGVGHDVAYEATVDLQRVHAPALEVRQGRIPRAEVVDGDFHAQITQRGERVLAEFAAARLEQRAFGELDGNELRSDAEPL